MFGIYSSHSSNFGAAHSAHIRDFPVLVRKAFYSELFMSKIPAGRRSDEELNCMADPVLSVCSETSDRSNTFGKNARAVNFQPHRLIIMPASGS